MTSAFRHGLASYISIIRPTKNRVLLRAVYATDGSDLAMTEEDQRQAVAHIIVSTGPGVDPDHFAVGDYCVHISAAADALETDYQGNPKGRFLFVHQDDIVCTFCPADLDFLIQEQASLAEALRRERLGLPPQ